MSPELSDALRRLERRRRGAAPRGPHRLAALCAALGDLHLAVPAIRVIGTDGKTSVARMIGACLDAVGVRTVVTTSPHLRCASERILLDGRVVDDVRLWTSLRRVTDVLPQVDDLLGERVTFFEALTATALDVAVAAGAQAVVVEAGIGGSGDATAAIPARTVALTPVGCDHPELGATPGETAAEKVGVLPTGGTLITGPQTTEVLEVVASVAAARRAAWSRHGLDHGVAWRRVTPGGQHVALYAGAITLRTWLPLAGAHQAANAATAIATVRAHLPSGAGEGAVVAADVIGPGDPRLSSGLASVRLPGRTEWHTTSAGVEVVLDGAHDEVAARALAEALRERPTRGATRLVLGCRGGRSSAALAGVVAGTTPCTAELVPPDDARDAVRRAVLASRAGDRVVVTGSLHLVGEVRADLVPVGRLVAVVGPPAPAPAASA